MQGVDLAVIDFGHLDEAEIIELAVASQAKVIVCSHVNRRLLTENLQRRAEKRGYQGTILVGSDLMSFILQ